MRGGGLYADRRAKAATETGRIRTLAWRTTVARLATNHDFREWIYETLDQLCAFARDEGVLTDFGQGIRAAASRIRNGLLEADEGVALMTDLAAREFADYHANVVRSEQREDNKENDECTE